MKSPKISVIITNYNYGEYIEQAIDSVVNQTFTDWELIIVDNGSTDNSINIISNYIQKYKNIKIYQHKNSENKGLVASLQLALSKAKGEYLAFLESDDYWDSKNLEKKIEIIKKYKNLSIIFNNAEIFGDQSRISSLRNRYNYCENIYKKTNWPSDISHFIGDLNIIITFSTLVVKRENFQKCDFNIPIDPHIDWWFYPQLAMMGDAYCILDKLTYYRVHPDSYGNSTQRNYSRERSKKFLIKLLEVLKKQNPNKYKEISTKTIIEKLIINKIDGLKFAKTKLINSFRDKKVYLYGAGIFAEQIINNYDLSSLNILGIIDTDKTKTNNYLGKYKIYHTDQTPELSPDIIIPCLANTELLYYSIQEWLLKKNIKATLIPNFFDEIKYQNILNKNAESIEKILSEILL